MVGSEIGGYKILEQVGEGRTGALYRGLDVNLDRPVAIRALNLDLGANPDLEQRFRAEIKPLGALHHTNLVTLYALVFEQGRPWLISEFIEGETFDQMIRRRGQIPVAEALPLFRQALAGIDSAHRLGLVHRDIKPANLMLDRQGIVKVTDFGLAKALSARGLAKAGTRLGSPFYMSPEQFLNKGDDARSDVYSLGVTLYEMLAGRVPFSADNDYQVMSDHVNTPPPPLAQFVPGIPNTMEQAVLKALVKSPDGRYQTAGEFNVALGGSPAATAPAAMASSARPVSPATAAVDSRASRDRKMIAAAVLLMLLLGGIWYALNKVKRTNAAPAPQATTASNAPPAPVAAPPAPDATAAPPDAAPPPADAAPADAAPAPAPPTVPAGTIVAVRMNDAVSSAANQAGQTFGATVDADVVVNGSVLVPSGSDAGVVLVKVAQVPEAERSDVQLQLVRLNINGMDYRARSSIFEQLSLPKTKKSVAKAGARAAVGAVGHFLSHGSAADGAAEGAASAFIVTIAPQTRIQFRLRKDIALAQ